MPGFVRAQVTLPAGSGIPADDAVNTWYFQSAGLDAAGTAADAQTKLNTFYQAIDGQMLSSGTIIGPLRTQYYDLTDPTPRVPILESTITVTLAAGAGFPTEVSICLSFQGDVVSGQPQARRRGRVFLGPLDADSSTTASGRVTVNTTVLSALGAAAEALEGGTLLTEAVWSVFSPTTAGPAPWSEGVLETAFTVVTNGWIDNAFDTQRRRGGEATLRELWP